MKNKFLALLLPFAIIAIAVAVIYSFSLAEKPIDKKAEAANVSSGYVNVQQLEAQSRSVNVNANGVVTARTKARLLPEVSGLVVKVSPKWRNGGFIKKGEVLLQIEKAQYLNQVSRAKASVAQTKSVYVQEQGLAEVAKKEWERRKRSDANESSKALALREPQLASAKSQYDAALSTLEAEKLRLAKTTIRAPFDGIVQNKSADIGQFVSVGQLLAEFSAVDYAEIRIPLTQSNQQLIELPGLKDSGKLAVKVILQNDQELLQYQGYLSHTEAVLDQVTKVLYGVVIVQDPYQLSKKGISPLRIGAYVSVEIPGKTIDNLYVLPPQTLRHGNKVWVVDDENVLQSISVKLLNNYDGEVIVSQGLSGKPRVVVGSVGQALLGKKVEIKTSDIAGQ